MKANKIMKSAIKRGLELSTNTPNAHPVAAAAITILLTVHAVHAVMAAAFNKR